MHTAEIAISLLKRATVELAANEKVSRWEPTGAASIRVGKDTIRVDGYWRISAIGNFLSLGLLGQLLIKPFFQKTRTEHIFIQNLERVIIHRRKKGVTFHIYQAREQGIVEVYVFVTDKKLVAEVIESLKDVIPPDRLQEQNDK